MALWKPFRGSRAALDAVEKHDGYVYFCVDDGSLFFDYIDADGVLQRKQINAKDAETLMGTSLDTIKSGIGTVATKAAANESAITAIKDGTTIDSFADVETALASKQPDWNENDETSLAYVKNRTHYTSIKNEFVDLTFSNYWNAGHPSTVTFRIEGVEYPDIQGTWTSGGSAGYTFIAGSYTIKMNYVSSEMSINPSATQKEMAVINEEIHLIDSKYLINSYLVNGSTNGSLRSINSVIESDTYTMGTDSFCVGYDTEASGGYSFASGNACKAKGLESHAEGGGAKATGSYSHAEGNATLAEGNSSHAEGSNTEAVGAYSHAEGYYSLADGDYQHVQGRYNIVDEFMAHIVGNGSHGNESNCHTLDWDGNAWYAGDVYVGSTSGTNKDSGSVKLAREDEVLLLDSQTLTEDQKTQVRTNIGAVEPKLITTISLSASSWTGTTSPYSQVVSVSGVTANSQVDFQPTAVQLATLQDLGISLMTENDGGIVTVYALNNKPTSDYTIQATITEVKGAGS